MSRKLSNEELEQMRIWVPLSCFEDNHNFNNEAKLIDTEGSTSIANQSGKVDINSGAYAIGPLVLRRACGYPKLQVMDLVKKPSLLEFPFLPGGAACFLLSLGVCFAGVLLCQDKVTLVAYLDFGFTWGSISVFSRNPVLERERELAAVGIRGKLRMARGFALLKTYFVNETTGDVVVEYKESCDVSCPRPGGRGWRERGKFRMAIGFAELKPVHLDTSSGDAIIEYNMSLCFIFKLV
ncbi:hypothetical protein Patl1_36087 [Pistacia atlantica]|nr:hypothetical protein Patl1_36087 [Pistacia atlantica]